MKLESCALLVGIQKGTATEKSSIAVPQETKRRITLRSRNSISEYTPKRNETRSQVWGLMPIIPELWRLRREHHLSLGGQGRV